MFCSPLKGKSHQTYRAFGFLWYRFRQSKTSQWTLLPYDEAQLKGLVCKRGVLECLGQTCQLIWNEPGTLVNPQTGLALDVLRNEQPVIGPMFMQANNASNLFSCVEEAFPDIGLTQLCRLTEFVPYIVLVLMGDNSKANARFRAWVENIVVEHNATSGPTLAFNAL